MKKIILFFAVFLCFIKSEARHIIGGEVIYEYLRPGTSPGSRVFRVTLRLFRDENSGTTGVAPLPASVTMAIYNNDNSSRVGNFRVVNQSFNELVPNNPLPPCITNAPDLLYRVGYYPFEVELLSNSMGYTAVFQTCCRVDGLMNTNNQMGATYTSRIPGNIEDNSPKFNMGVDVVCYQKPFTLDFSANDADGDSLVYSFCDAYNGGAAIDASYATPAPPPYGSITYTNGYTGIRPLGNQATINPRTGIISGIAPNAGEYVISVCVTSYKNGTYVSTHRKDFIVTVAACSFTGAELNPDYISCDGFSFNFKNLNSASTAQNYRWDFGDPGSGTQNTSTLAAPTHTYSDTGVYTMTVIASNGNGCEDTATAIVRVFPGFFPGFGANSPVCKGAPLNFLDQTIANYGQPNSWVWDFGVNNSLADTSRLQNPSYTYADTGTYSVRLIVGSSKGCLDTISLPVQVVSKPAIQIPNDTLICKKDTLQLNLISNSPGNVVWSPNYNISDVNSFTPLVYPQVPTTYTFSFADNFGCAAVDSVRINLTDSVWTYTGNDTTICLTDAIQLTLFSNALYYAWTPSATLNDPNIQNPLATPSDPSTTYIVTAKISERCMRVDSVVIRTVPYPNADAGADTTICLGGSVNLIASGGSSYIWSPSIYLSNPSIANPQVINPPSSTTYIVRVTDVLGCPKPGFDTVTVDVLEVQANAGADTAVVLGQPLQLNASGGSIYSWSPSTYLSSNDINNPVCVPQTDISYVVTVTDGPGCMDTDTLKIKLYLFDADIRVPSAFTPNGDGLNDIIRPIAIGMRSVDVFRIYNRLGELIYSTSRINEGWNGIFRGKKQSTGTFVWYAEGITYDNRKIFRKGYVLLIR
jgi:hypothetical protein